MANVADNFLGYFRTSDATYDTNNQGAGIGTNGLSLVSVDRFVASNPYFAAQLYKDAAGNYQIGIRGSETANYLARLGRNSLRIAPYELSFFRRITFH